MPGSGVRVPHNPLVWQHFLIYPLNSKYPSEQVFSTIHVNCICTYAPLPLVLRVEFNRLVVVLIHKPIAMRRLAKTGCHVTAQFW
jgi:hypothetical protein